MGVLFSAVTVTAGDKQSEFLVAGIPKEYGDLEGWTLFEEFMDELDEECTVRVHADAYVYGEGEEFIAIAQAGVTDIKNNRINGWTLTDNRFFSMPDNFTGHRIINELVMPKKITTGSADDTLCQLPDRWRNIMPYLMANRLYLDDDAAKAGYYWNLYMDMRNEILASESRLAVAVVGGIDIDGWCY